MKKISLIFIAVAVLFAFVGPVSAIGSITFPYDGNLVVTYVSSDAGYNNEFGISSPVLQKLGFIHNEKVGTQYTNVGKCSANSNVVLYISTPQGYTYYTDNLGADSVDHAYLTSSGSGYNLNYNVAFEDTYNGGDMDHNDVVLSVSCTPDVTPAPEFPTIALPAAFIIGIFGIVLFVRETKKE
jgi:hypothetical protein